MSAYGKEPAGPVLLSAPKAAVYCGVSRNTVCYWIREGKLKYYRTPGGRYLIRPADLEEFMLEHGMFVPPEVRRMAQADRRQTAQTEEGTGEPGVLVVDDDHLSRMVVIRALESLEMPILEASTGYQALHILTENPSVALVVLDLVMPGQHGVDTLSEIKRHNPQLPVIVVTGYPPGRPGNRGFDEAQPDALLTKPFKRKDLVQAARSLLADSEEPAGQTAPVE